MLRLCVYFFLLTPFISYLSFVNAEVASVNDKKIKQSYLEFIKSEVNKQGKKVNGEMEKIIVDRLIDLEVINQKAKSSGLLKNERILAQAELSTQELIYTLYLQDYIVRNPITKQEIETAYNQYKSAFNEKEYKASHILVASENKAQSVIGELNAGEDFGNAVKKESEDKETNNNGGDLGWFSKETMVQSFFDAAQNTAPGQIYPTPVKTQFGWHIIKIDEVRPLKLPTLSEKEDSLKTELQKSKLKKHLSALRTSARILKSE